MPFDRFEPERRPGASLSTVTETRDFPQRGVPLVWRTQAGTTNTPLVHDLQAGFPEPSPRSAGTLTGALFTARVHGGCIGPSTTLTGALFTARVHGGCIGPSTTLTGALSSAVRPLGRALYGACTECSTGHCEALFSALAAVLCRALRRAPLWAVPHARSSGVVSAAERVDTRGGECSPRHCFEHRV